MNLLAMFGAVSPGLVARGAWHHVRTALRAASNAPGAPRGFDWLDEAWRQLRAETPASPSLTPLRGVAFARAVSPTDAELGLDGRTVRVTALADDVVLFEAGPPHAYAASTDGFPGAGLALEDGLAALTLRTKAVTLTVAKDTGALRVEAGGAVVADDVEFLSAASGVGFRARVGDGATFHGLGERAAAFDLSGGRYTLWNTDPALYRRGDDPLYLSIPFLVAQAGGRATGFFFDNPHRAQVDVGASERGRLEWLVHGGALRLFVVTGTPAEVLERYTALTGRARLPPLWALGFHQSRHSYFPQACVLEVAKAFRRRRIPCDVLHLDIHHMDGYRSFTWHPRDFAEPRALTAELHALGFKALAIVDPGIKVEPGYRVYDEGVARGAFLRWPDGAPFVGPVWPGDCHFPDFSSPEVRAWWGGQYRGLLDDGVDAFWNDMNEVALITVPVGAQLPGALRHDAEGKGASHDELHNLYGQLMAKASVDGLEALRPQARGVVLTRSGWAGVQRHAMHWTGDNHSTWDDLRLSLQMVLNLGLSGVAFTGPDTGGFSGGPSPELFARWMQLSSFFPFFRVHSVLGSPDQEPWAFGDEVEAIARAAIEQRYRLLPYLYTAAWQTTRTGAPVVRPMSFGFPGDARFAGVDDQFLVGDALLVAPVLERGATSRRVLLPEGPWFELATGARHDGGGRVEVPAPLEVVPVFVRGGAVVPRWNVQQYVGEGVHELELLVAPAPGEHESLLYEDDGMTRGGPFRVTRFTVRGRELERSTLEGTYQPPSVPVRVLAVDALPLRHELDAGA